MSESHIFDRVALIQASTLDQLRDEAYLHDLIVSLGFNAENVHEQPKIVTDNPGGLLIWQYPNQFARFLATFVAKHPIRSYIEIGCRWGGTFILMSSYIRRLHNASTTAAVDIEVSPNTIAYCSKTPDSEFLHMSSTSPEYRAYIADKTFDMVFIDGDHSYEGVRADFEMNERHGQMFVFHDIVNHACLGVNDFWCELRASRAAEFDFYEFTDQYAEVFQRTKASYLGIGVAVRKVRI